MKKANLFVAAVLFALTSCKDLGGTLSVREVISLNSEAGAQVQIQPGNYSGALKVNSKKKIKLEMKLPGQQVAFIFKTSQNLKDLKSGDRVQVSASTSGQPYDIDGIYQVTSSSTQPQRSVESCSYNTTEYRCHRVTTPQTCQIVKECDPSDPSQCAEREVCTGGETRDVCGNETVSIPGNKDVEYYYTTTTEGVRLQLLANQRSVTEFTGSDSSSDKHYTFQGVCR